MDDAPRRSTVHAVRLTPGEVAVLRGRARSAGVPVSTYVRQRALARRFRVRGGRLRRDEVDRLVRVGRELNRFAHAANSARRVVASEELEALLGEFGLALEALRASASS